METWESVTSMKDFDSFTIRKAPVPEYNEDSYQLAFSRCKENKCGTYDTNWGCNPGAKRDVAEYYKGIDYVILAYREFEADFNDTELMKSISDDVHRTLRMMVLELRDNGIECDGFMDGPCDYCGECAYPEPCRFPDMMIPSVSTLGIDLKKYFAGLDIPYSFQNGRMILYGFIFVHKSA